MISRPSCAMNGIGSLTLPAPQPLRQRRSRNADRHHAELLSLVVAVCLALFVCKSILATRAFDSAVASFGRVAACCAEDVAVGLGCLLSAGIALSWRSGSVYRALVRIVCHLFALAAL